MTHPAQDENFRSLPRTLSGFIGREREKPKILHLLETARLVTLTGTGGTGKTRLALEAAADTDAVAFVDLAPLSDGELIGAAFETTIEDKHLAGGIGNFTFGKRTDCLTDILGRAPAFVEQ